MIEVIKEFNLPITYRTDEIARRKRAHAVLIFYYCVTSPTELIWNNLKRGTRRNHKFSNLSATVIHLVRTEVEKIDQQLRENCVKNPLKISVSANIPKTLKRKLTVITVNVITK